MPMIPFPLPDLEPLTRLYVHDSLRVNADRWLLAHNYHRQRQNLHYQSLWQPGIIQGLGVKLIDPPEVAHSQFKGAFWVEVQPGLAIDGEGNPIIVEPEPIANRIYPLVIPTPLEAEQTLYIVLRYVDPDGLEIEPETDRMLERFRFDQRADALEPLDIELCRIQLRRGEVQLAPPHNPLRPHDHQLDFRHRPQAQRRSHHWLTLQPLNRLPQHKLHCFGALSEAIAGLYPQMQLSFDEAPMVFSPEALASLPHLLYGSVQDLITVGGGQDPRVVSGLRDYLNRHGCLLIETATLSPEVMTWLGSIKRNLDLQPVAQGHDLRRQPFLFTTWPQPLNQPIDLLWDDGLLVIVGELVNLWGGDRLSRTEIREAHEWGINLLYYVGRRYQLGQLLG